MYSRYGSFHTSIPNGRHLMFVKKVKCQKHYFFLSIFSILMRLSTDFNQMMYGTVHRYSTGTLLVILEYRGFEVGKYRSNCTCELCTGMVPTYTRYRFCTVPTVLCVVRYLGTYQCCGSRSGRIRNYLRSRIRIRNY